MKKNFTRLFTLFLCGFILSSFPLAIAQVPTVTWTDTFDSDIGRQGYDRGVALPAINNYCGLISGYSGSSAFIDGTSNSTARISYGFSNTDVRFYNFLQQHIGTDTWVSFIFVIDKIPTDYSFAPNINILKIGSRGGPADSATPNYGWEIDLQVLVQDSSHGQFMVHVAHDSNRDLLQLINGNYVFGEWHRISFRLNFVTDPNTCLGLKEIWYDDTLIASPNLSVTCLSGGTATYFLGQPIQMTSNPYGVYPTQTYARFMVDDMYGWFGSTYYQYDWSSSRNVNSWFSGLTAWLRNLLGPNWLLWLLLIIIVLIVIYVMTRKH